MQDALKEGSDEQRLSSVEGTSIDTIDAENLKAEETEKQSKFIVPPKVETKTATSPSAYNYSSTINNGYTKPAIRSQTFII